jgi:hypothetical protein
VNPNSLGVAGLGSTRLPAWEYLCRFFELHEDRLIVEMAILLVVVAVIPIWLVRFPPLQDYPLHLLRENIVAHYSDPTLGYRNAFDVSLFPMPYILPDYLVCPLARLLPITIAGKILLTLCVVLLPVSFFFLSSSLARNKLILGFFAFPLIYNFHLEVGETNTALSLPLFLFALGYWWRHHKQPTWKTNGFLCGLVFLVYICHLYTFCYLAFSIVVLELFESRKVSRVLTSLIPFLPAVFLLGLTFVNPSLRSALRIESPRGPVFIEYSTLKGEMRTVINSKFDRSYLTTFSPERERRLWIASLLLFGCLLLSRRPSHLEKAFLTLLAGLAVLYVLLPPMILLPQGLAEEISLRTLILILLVAPLCISPPPSGNRRLLVFGFLILLSLYSLQGNLKDWIFAGARLDDFYAVLKQIPADERVSFRIHKDAMYIGNIDPFIYFGAYYYLEQGAPRATDPADVGLRDEMSGPFRSVHYRHASAPQSELETIFLHRAQARFGWYTIILLHNQRDQVHSLAEKYGFETVFENRSIGVYRRTQTPLPITNWFPGDYFVVGMKDGYNFLLLWQSPSVPWPSITNGFELIASRGNATLWRRRLLLNSALCDISLHNRSRRGCYCRTSAAVRTPGIAIRNYPSDSPSSASRVGQFR